MLYDASYQRIAALGTYLHSLKTMTIRRLLQVKLLLSYSRKKLFVWPTATEYAEEDQGKVCSSKLVFPCCHGSFDAGSHPGRNSVAPFSKARLKYSKGHHK